MSIAVFPIVRSALPCVSDSNMALNNWSPSRFSMKASEWCVSSLAWASASSLLCLCFSSHSISFSRTALKSKFKYHLASYKFALSHCTLSTISYSIHNSVSDVMELKNQYACKIWVFHSGLFEDSDLLGYDTVTGFEFPDILKEHCAIIFRAWGVQEEWQICPQHFELFLDPTTPKDGSTTFIQNTGKPLSGPESHIRTCECIFDVQVRYFRGGGAVVIMTVLQTKTGKLQWNAQHRQPFFSSVLYVHRLSWGYPVSCPVGNAVVSSTVKLLGHELPHVCIQCWG